MFAPRFSHYVPLPDESQLGHNNCESSNDSLDSPSYLEEKRPRAQGIPWTLVVVIACTLVNVALNAFPTLTQRKVVSPAETVITRQNIHLLRRPNQYIGFDDIPRPIPPLSRQLSTYPILLSLVDAASPDTVFDDDFAAQMVHSGTITPDDRRVWVTLTMSTIIQFRAIDWGMETCELHIDLPESYGLASQSGSLAIYRINSTIPLDSASLSHNTRPPRVAKLGSIPLGKGIVTWHRKLSCVTDEVLSFELGCAPLEESGGDPDCLVEWVQIKNTIPGEPAQIWVVSWNNLGSGWRHSNPYGATFNDLIRLGLSRHDRTPNGSTFRV